jgi:phospholipase C
VAHGSDEPLTDPASLGCGAHTFQGGEGLDSAPGLTRRQTLQRIGAAGLGLTALGGGLEALMAGAAAAAPAQGSLKDIEHVIFLIQENRSFDHYFGTLSGVRGFGDKHVLPYFAAYNTPGELADRGLNTTYPADFMADIKHSALPSVSWVLTNLAATEHPGFSAAISGEIAVAQIVKAVMSNPKVWRKTALFITWDENGGFFDHVAPPVAPKGTKGEYLTVAKLPAAANGIRGPIGLGFRVPMLIVSPFTRGGLVCSDTFDHTSMLRFIETRFGVEVPNLSAWRRRVTGDLTGAFTFAAKPNDRRPKLKQPGTTRGANCTPSADKPVPLLSARFPTQEQGTRKRPSGIVRKKTKGK